MNMSPFKANCDDRKGTRTTLRLQHPQAVPAVLIQTSPLVMLVRCTDCVAHQINNCSLTNGPMVVKVLTSAGFGLRSTRVAGSSYVLWSNRGPS